MFKIKDTKKGIFRIYNKQQQKYKIISGDFKESFEIRILGATD